MKILLIILVIIYYFFRNQELIEGLIVIGGDKINNKINNEWKKFTRNFDKNNKLSLNNTIYEVCADKDNENIILNDYYKKENDVNPQPKGFYSYMLDTAGRKEDNYFDPPICKNKREFKKNDYFINNKLVDCLPLPHGKCDSLNNNHNKKNNYKENRLPLEDPFYLHSNVGENYRITFDKRIIESIENAHINNELENEEIYNMIENIKNKETEF